MFYKPIKTHPSDIKTLFGRGNSYLFKKQPYNNISTIQFKVIIENTS